jgi:hypothetical protein
MGTGVVARGAAGAGTVAVAAAVNVATGMLTQHWAVAWWACTAVLVVAGGGLQWWLTVAGSGSPAGDRGGKETAQPAAGSVVNTITGSTVTGPVIQAGSVGSVGPVGGPPGPVRQQPPALPGQPAAGDASGDGRKS